MDLTLSVGDRLPALRVQCLDANGAPVDLTGCTAEFGMWAVGETAAAIPYTAATVESAVSGLLSYAWGATDTDTAGLYEGRFQVTDGGGLVQTVRHITIEIEAV